MSNKYTTILIGNGLGMAIDPEHFKLESGLKHAWDKLEKDQQDNIKKLITNGMKLTNEEQLYEHYEAIQACLTFNRIEDLSKQKWLVPAAKKFPDYFRNFVANTAWYFYDYPIEEIQKSKKNLLNNFLDKLTNYVQNNYTHIATLNYDNLIYGKFRESDILKKKLTDGFYTNTVGFQPMVFNSRPGYYLHLHGSPLFYTDLESNICEQNIINKGSNRNEKNHLREHIILCKTSLKPKLISNSFLLDSYWYFFTKALRQSKKLVLFGYSGNDLHVNKVIEKAKHLQIVIVEYNAKSKTIEDRRVFWARQLKKPMNYFNEQNLILLESILEYAF